MIGSCAGFFERTDLRVEFVCWGSKGSDGRLEISK